MQEKLKGLRNKSTGIIQDDNELKIQWEKELIDELEEGEKIENYKNKIPFEKWKQDLIDTNDYDEVEDVMEAFYKKICNQYVDTRGEHYIVEDNDGIHYLELDDEYNDVNKDNYKKLLKNGEDRVFTTYQDIYKCIVEYNIYEDLSNKNYGYTIDNFYLSKSDFEKLGLDVTFSLKSNTGIDEEQEI